MHLIALHILMGNFSATATWTNSLKQESNMVFLFAQFLLHGKGNGYDEWVGIFCVHSQNIGHFEKKSRFFNISLLLGAENNNN